MQRIRKTVCALVIIIFIFSCDSKKYKRQEELQGVFVFLINTKAIPLPPPPPPPNDSLSSWEIPKNIIDSLKKVKLKIAVYPSLTKPNISENFETNNVPKGFKEIINQFSSIKSQHYIPIDQINRNSPHNVNIADTLVLKKSRDWKEYDLLFSFSNVAFNKTYNKAALTLGISRSSLWGSTSLYLLDKNINNEWMIIKSYQLGIW